jgi:signal peptidase I
MVLGACTTGPSADKPASTSPAVESVVVTTASMEPTLHGCPSCTDDHILVALVPEHYRATRGVIVVFRRPTTWASDPQVTVISRVIGRAGDVVTLTSGHVLVNKTAITEPYLNRSCPTMTSLSESPRARESMTSGTIPAGEVWVMGDNRCDSQDSRGLGPVPIADIIGTAVAIVSPADRARALPA